MKLFFVLCILSLAYRGVSQEFFNLDFEKEAEKGQPRKWFIEGEDQFVAGLTEETAHSGRRSLSVSVTGGQAVVYLSINKRLVAGKTVAVGGFIRSATAEGLHLLLAFKDPAGPKPVIFPIENTAVGDWINVGAKRTFESYTSDRLLIAIIVAGNGQVFIDDFKLVIDDVEVSDKDFEEEEPSASTLKMLNREALPFTWGKSFTGKAFENMIGHAKIVALGENSHGSSTIYKTKLMLIQELIPNGFTIFALESPEDDARRVNEYVTGEEVTREEILKSLVYPSWKTPEMLDIIGWLRRYNKTNAKQIQFKGFDVKDKDGVDRDRVMAETVKRWLDSSPEDRIILSADNTHVTKATGKMGSYLQQWYGEKYISIGFTFGEGTYAAYGPANPYQVHPPYRGTAEYLLSGMKPDNFILDLRPARVYAVFNRNYGFRSIGSRPQETTQFSEIHLPTHFDIIVFQKESKHTVSLTR